MFPLGHMTYSLAASNDHSSDQIVGTIVADAATTGAFGWDDLHEPAKVAAFEQTLRVSQLADFVKGLRHHVELDDRSHNSWAGGGGYAYDKQTPELRSAVQTACSVDDVLARTLAHNFIECAVDIRLAEQQPERMETLQNAISAFAVSEPATALALWKQSDVGAMKHKLSAFLDLWLRHDLTTIDGMVALWTELLAVLKAATFETNDTTPLDTDAADAAIRLAMDIVRLDFGEVVEPR